MWVDLYNPNLAACSSDPSTCDQIVTDKDITTVVPVINMNVLDFADVDGANPCLRLRNNLSVEGEDCSNNTNQVLCESSCTPLGILLFFQIFQCNRKQVL